MKAVEGLQLLLVSAAPFMLVESEGGSLLPGSPFGFGCRW